MKRITRTILAWLGAMAIVGSFFGIQISAESVAARGKCGSSVTWELYTDGTLKLTGSGTMADYYSDTPGYYAYRTDIKTVSVSGGIQSIGAYAFYDLPNLTRATIGAGVTEIGDCAFAECESLASVSLPSGVTSIDYEAFYLCRKLDNLVVPSTVTVIGNEAFFGCTALSSVTLFQGLKTVGDWAFFYCGSLSSVSIPTTVTSIGAHAFEHSGISSVTIPSSVTNIGDYAFGYVYNEATNDEIPLAGFQILGYSGTAAESYAKENGFGFNCGHLWNSGKVLRQATTSQTGMIAYTCTICGAAMTEEIPKIEVQADTRSDTQTDTQTEIQTDTQTETQPKSQTPESKNTESTTPETKTPESVTPETKNPESTTPESQTPEEKEPDIQTQEDTQTETPEITFTDVAQGQWYTDAVSWAVEMGITTGTSSTSFAPNQTCSRAQIVTFLWRAAGEPEPSGSNPFTDVSSSQYYYKPVLWAYENGITTGTSDTSFSPNQSCNRAQIVTFLWRWEGAETSATSASQFTDVSAGWYEQAVSWAVAGGITNGTSDHTFSPNQSCTRAQAVTFLYRDCVN